MQEFHRWGHDFGPANREVGGRFIPAQGALPASGLEPSSSPNAGNLIDDTPVDLFLWDEQCPRPSMWFSQLTRERS